MNSTPDPTLSYGSLTILVKCYVNRDRLCWNRSFSRFTLGFWQKIDSYEEQPDIHFEHDLIVLLETSDPDETISWSTMSNLNSFLGGGNRIRTPLIKSTETDWNRDGILDYIDFEIEMPLQDHEIIYGVQLYMLFDFKLYVSIPKYFSSPKILRLTSKIKLPF